MSLLIKTLAKRKIFEACRGLTAIQARKGHWYPYYKPGPYPKTKEEREAAAKKYNLLPEEYEPYPEDHVFALGDYPKLPAIPIEERDPWYPWDFAELRRGFNEPIHCDSMLLLPETSTSYEEIWENVKGFGIFLTYVLGFCTVLHLLNSIEWVRPAMEKQYPTPGVTHYTFELDYEELERRKKKKIVCVEE